MVQRVPRDSPRNERTITTHKGGKPRDKPRRPHDEVQVPLTEVPNGTKRGVSQEA